MEAHESSRGKHITSKKWGSNQFHLPKRSQLYSLEPISPNNYNREGLSSYICRLAEAHSVSPGVLIKQEILPNFRKRYTVGSNAIYQLIGNESEINVTQIPKPAYSKNVNERGLLSFQYIEGLKALVLINNLHSLTIPFRLEQKHSRNTFLASRFRRWCPECFRSGISLEATIYEPLIWSITAVKLCPAHHYPLQMRCSKCGKTQRPLTNKMQVGRCSQCFEWLTEVDNEFSQISSLKNNDWQVFVSETIKIALANSDGMIPEDLKPQLRSTLAEWNKLEKETFNDPLSFQEQNFLLETLLC